MHRQARVPVSGLGFGTLRKRWAGGNYGLAWVGRNSAVPVPSDRSSHRLGSGFLRR